MPELEHQRQRKIIVPRWHKSNLDSCGKNIIAITRSIIANLIADNAFDVRQIMKRISIEVILQEIFGSNDHLIREKIKETIVDLFDLFGSPALSAYLLSPRFFPSLLEQELGIWGKVKIYNANLMNRSMLRLRRANRTTFRSLIFFRY